ncbi:MAG: hypothetical protein AAF570_21520, partial [Bacteroidota bacterium]
MIENTTTYRPAEDKFETYYAEKLWEMIPQVYRYEDGLGPHPDVLRSFVLILAKQAAILRRSQDRLWDDQFIELCDDWAVPYIGELLGTRLVSASNARGRRVDVAKTIYYRRRKGTLRVLEELISDIAGWEGKVVEQFRKLGRSRHGLDPQPLKLVGELSGTQPGGWADIRRQNASELAGGPFGEFFHSGDVRQHRGTDGRYNIPKLAFHLYRLQAYSMTDVTPFDAGDATRFSFDPSGRSIPLFNRRARGDAEEYDWQEWTTAKEWEVPGPIRCRLLGHTGYEFTEENIDALVADPGMTLAAQTDLRTLIGHRIESEVRLLETLMALPSSGDIVVAPDYELYLAILEATLLDEVGKSALLPATLAVEIFGNPYAIAPTMAGGLENWNAVGIPPEKELIVDAEMGRFRFVDPLDGESLQGLCVAYHYGFSDDIGAGPYDRRAVEDSEPTSFVSGGGIITAAQLLNNGVTQIDDSRTYGRLPNKAQVQNLTFQAANQTRPYIR